MPDSNTTRRSFFGFSAGAALLCAIGGEEVRLDDPDAARKADVLASQVKRPPGAAPQDELTFPTGAAAGRLPDVEARAEVLSGR